jgi:hypothetical protein
MEEIEMVGGKEEEKEESKVRRRKEREKKRGKNWGRERKVDQERAQQIEI